MIRKKILVIDDNPVVLRMNQSLLPAAGYAVLSAASAEEGFRMAREESPDMILLDVILPKMHGFELCRQLKQHAQTKHIPVVIVTGTGLTDVVRQEPGIGADDYLSKPYGKAELEAVVSRVFGRK